MNLTPQARQRFWNLLAVLLIASGIIVFIITAMRDHMVYFLSPSEWYNQKNEPKIKNAKQLRLGGLVQKGSVSTSNGYLRFIVSDHIKSIKVIFKGSAPSLFREEQGVVILGKFDDRGAFQAQQILAKHDERYIPKDVADRLKKKKLWKG